MADPSHPLAVGVDVGGTWIRIHASAGPPARRAKSARVWPGVDLQTHLVAVWQRHGWSARDVAALVVASKGIWTRAECQRVARRLRRFARAVRVMPDAQAAALGALDGQPGVLVLSGTGSIVVGHDGRGRWARAGGFGPLLGDEGSGFWLGREWVRATTTPATSRRSGSSRTRRSLPPRSPRSRRRCWPARARATPSPRASSARVSGVSPPAPSTSRGACG